MSTVAKQLLKPAYRLLMGDDEPDTDNLNNGMVVLNAMLNEWSTRRSGIYAVTKETHVLTIGTGEYSIGPGADIDTTRPIRILDAYIDNNNSDYGVRIVDREWWNRRAYKELTAIPSELYYEPTYPNGTIRLYPEPSGAYTLNLDSQKALAQYTAITNDVGLPPEYETALKFNLAIDWANELGVEPSRVIVGRAAESYKTLRVLHAQPAKRILTNIMGGQARDYDITGDIYC
jgi:hypothetical protein